MVKLAKKSVDPCIGSVYPTLPTAWVFGAVGRRAPSARPPTTCPVLGAMTDEVSLASMNVADTPRSQLTVGRANSSASMPSLRAVGTLNTIREEQVPAVVGACRFLMSE